MRTWKTEMWGPGGGGEKGPSTYIDGLPNIPLPEPNHWSSSIYLKDHQNHDERYGYRGVDECFGFVWTHFANKWEKPAPEDRQIWVSAHWHNPHASQELRHDPDWTLQEAVSEIERLAVEYDQSGGVTFRGERLPDLPGYEVFYEAQVGDLALIQDTNLARKPDGQWAHYAETTSAFVRITRVPQTRIARGVRGLVELKEKWRGDGFRDDGVKFEPEPIAGYTEIIGKFPRESGPFYRKV